MASRTPAPPLGVVLDLWIDEAGEDESALPVTFDAAGDLVLDEAEARRRLTKTVEVEEWHHDSLVRELRALLDFVEREP